MGADGPIPATQHKEPPPVKDDETAASEQQSGQSASDRRSADHSAAAGHHDANSDTGRNQARSAATPWRRWLLVGGVLTILGGLGGVEWVRFSRVDPEQTFIDVMGNIDVRQVNLAFKVDGRIETLAVDEGDAVKAGDVIATLDKRYFHDDLRVLCAKRANLAASLAKLEHGSRPEEIAEARAQTTDKEAALIKAREDFHRAEALVDKGGVSRQDFDKYRSALESAESQHNAALDSQRLVEIGPRQEDIDMARALLAEQDATIEQSERRLADADLYAPNDGVILTRARERGAIVQAGETVFTLTLVSPVWVRTYVNERDLGLIYPDMAAMVVTDSAPNRPYSGRIGFISPTAEFTPKSVETRELRTDLVYRLRVVVENPDRGLRQGMPVSVHLQLREPLQKTFWQRLQESLPFQKN